MNLKQQSKDRCGEDAGDRKAGTTAPSFFALVTEKLARQPELLAVARGNCARWLSESHSAPQRLREWDALLAAAEQGEAGRRRLREVLAGASEADARRMRGCGNFIRLREY